MRQRGAERHFRQKDSEVMVYTETTLFSFMKNLIENWSQFDVKVAFAICIAYILIDGMYAYYTQAVTKKKPLASATTGALMHFLIAFGVLNYVQNYLYIIPLAIGSWIGTYLVVKRDAQSQ